MQITLDSLIVAFGNGWQNMTKTSNVHNHDFETPGRVAQTGGNGGGNDLGERIARLETEMKHLATKEDIQSMRTDIEKAINTQLKWGVGILVFTILSIVAVAYK